MSELIKFRVYEGVRGKLMIERAGHGFLSDQLRNAGLKDGDILVLSKTSQFSDALSRGEYDALMQQTPLIGETRRWNKLHGARYDFTVEAVFDQWTTVRYSYGAALANERTDKVLRESTVVGTSVVAVARSLGKPAEPSPFRWWIVQPVRAGHGNEVRILARTQKDAEELGAKALNYFAVTSRAL